MTRGRSLDDLEALREGVGQLIGVTFGGAYKLSYTTRIEEGQLPPDILDYPYVREIRRQSQGGQVVPFDGDTDWALVVDLVRALGTEVAIEARCSALNAYDSEPASADKSTGQVMRRQWMLAALLSGKGKTASDAPLQLSAAKALAQMQEIDSEDPRCLTLQIFVASRQELPPAVLDTIGVELAGSSPFTVSTFDDSMADSSGMVQKPIDSWWE